MAAVAEMGEVEDMLSKDEGNIVTNGDLSSDVDMENQDIEDNVKKPTENSLDTKEKPESGTEESNDASEEGNNASEEGNGASEEGIIENHSESENPLAEEETPQEDKPSEKETPMEEDEEEEEEDSSPDVKNSEEQETNESQLEAAIDESSQETKASEDQTEDDDTESKTIDDENSKQSATSSELSTKKFEEEKVVEIHEIDSDEDDEVSISKINNGDPIELNDSGGEDGDEGDVMIVDTETSKANGTATEIIDLATPEKKKKPVEVVEELPRRSSRNLNKTKSYAETDKEDEKESSKPVRAEVETPRAKAVQPKGDSEESDIEEILPQDPLACNDAITVERIPSEKSKVTPKKAPPIVVNDTKRLVEIASKSNTSSSSSSSTSVPQGKKEPTLVIIDTNSILSGRGPVPVNNKQPQNSIPTTASYQTVLPMALPAQGMYPPNMRATITPIPVNSSALSAQHQQKLSPATITPALTTPLLPTLTDDMFVVEAPSFIVPYVYEKPPVKDFKDFVKEIQTQIKKKEEKDEAESKKGEDGAEDEKMDVDESEKPNKAEDKSDPNFVPDSKKELEDAKKPYSYFDSPLGKFFINIGFNLVQEFVQTDLLKQQKRKHSREGGSNPETEKTIKSLVKNLQYSKENNEHFKTVLKKCEFCNFKTESALAMSYHLETPHMKNFVYKCNFCAYEVRSPHDILFHMEAEHAVRGHLERAPAFHQCPNCPFEDNQKGKLSRHLVTCMRKFKPERNLDPPVDWEPPAKIPRVPKMRQQGLNATAAAYQALSKNTQYQFLSKMQLQSTQSAINRGRGRPTLGPNINIKSQGAMIRPPGMLFKQQTMSGGSVLVPTNYQLSGNQVFQNPAAQASAQKKPAQQPSISITPLPRTTPSAAAAASGSSGGAKPGDTSSKNSFVICEICDGYIKDLEQLRNHMQWIHKIKIHPKMIYNRPPLNCQKCQFRFFTDQGLERHLLGSHGLVTSSMQDAANKSKDSGRCPVCGRVYQWKLLNHVARDHNMTLKPAHLSYKCTVCTATFGMYKQFENHVYSAHSVVAKRVMDKKGGSTTSSTTSNSSPKPSAADQLKPLKINDEITIIPQPAKSTANGKEEKSSPSTSKNPEASSSGSSRAERLARRNATEED
ncbi:MOG interacting and ectopic P-granules protein 1 isoform X2 [Diabrotica virgifera virgifera]|uniref:C2H2-type domain-containing protein n=1 Tax=Diabrotica virgifera virgifera TaxID=50390 RepID=A0ABM5L5W6_DIAVI|nr:MOG interacting and ectopic P-granules protein 1 isoform X2 [Diabrotica virgifera virgifera]